MTTPTTTEFNALQTRISRIYEIGDGDFGYGQSALSQQLDLLVPASTLDFQNLRTDILAAKQHQVGVLATLPITPVTNTLTSAQWTAFSTVLAQVEVNRLVVPPAAQAARDILLADTVTTEWNGLTTQEVTVSFSNEDAMRNYFNAGSSIEFSASRTAGAATTKNTSWTSLLTNIGVVSFKRNATSSTKAVGTSIGYSKLTDTDQVVFRKLTTDTLKPNSYVLKARLLDTTTIVFTVEFLDGSTSLSDPNVSGTLTSTVNAYHASGVFVSVPAPTAVSDLTIGTPNPSFTITRDATNIGEGQLGVTFTVNAVNFPDAPLYWRVTGYGITAADFVENTLQDQFNVLTGVGTFSLTAAADLFTEGPEKFVVELRVAPELTSPVVASISSAPETINDLSVTVPVVISSPSYNFVSQSVSAVNEGYTISYTVVTTSVPDGTQLYWSTKGLTAGITAADFEDNTLSGSIVIFNNTATIDRTVINDNVVEAVESFQIVLSTIDSKTGLRRQVQISYLIQIIDTQVVVADVPYVVANSLTTAPEGSSVGINFKITTPKLPLGTRVYWQTFADVGTMTSSDFNDGALTGYTVITNQVGTVTRYVKADSITEGLESFHIVFYSDSQMTNELVQSNTVSITESVNYTITKNASSMAEGGLGIEYTVNSPALENGTILYYTVVSESGTVDADDLVDGTTGTFTVNNNTGKFLIRAKADVLTEGAEQFHADVRATSGVSGSILVSSQSASITEPEVYDILSQRSEIVEGQIGVDFVIKTPKLPAGTVLYWSTVTDTGTITASDFTDNTLSGTVTITNNIGTITRTAADDALTEGNESFHLVLRTGSASGTQVKVGDPVIISEFVKYTITASTQSISEGAAGVTFNITTPKVANGTVVYWSTLAHAGEITTNDFIVSDAAGGSAQRLTGQISIQNNRGSLVISGRPDSLTEGNESFQIELRLEAIDGPVQSTSRIVTISEIVPYQLIAGASTVTEGPGSVTFTVRTPSRADGTMFWTTRTASGTITDTDFSDGLLEGTVDITGNTGTIIRTAVADKTTEGVDAFVIELRAISSGSPVLVSSTPVVITDTSLDPIVEEVDPPTYAIAVDHSSITKGGTAIFTVATTNVTSATNLYWTLFRSPGLEITDFTSANSPSALHVTYNSGTPENGTLVVPVQTVSNQLNQGVRSFIFELRTGSIYGPVVATSASAVTISDEVKYNIAASTRSISEGAGSVTFTVTTPAAGYGQTLTWTAVGNTGTLTADDFSDGANPAGPGSLTGSVSINGSGTGTFTLYAAADATTEGNESFHIELANGVTAITLGTPAPVIAISEIVEYVLSSNTTTISEGGAGVTFTLTTPKLAANATFNYTIVGKTGSIAAQDFTNGATPPVVSSSLTGSFTVASLSNTGSFTLYANADSTTEGDESFYVTITSATGQTIAIGGTGSPVVTITESVVYTIVPTASELSNVQVTSFAQTAVAYFKITTPKMDDGVLYWVIESVTGDVNALDFDDKTVSGTVSIVKNTGLITIKHANDTMTEGTESYRVVLKRDSIQGTTLTTSPDISITETVQYTVTSNVAAIAEGGSVIFTVTTPYTDNGEVLTWTAVQSTGTVIPADFVNNTGTVTVDANSTATFTVTAATDSNNSESNDSFTVTITKGGVAISPLAAAIPVITISDSTKYLLTATPTTIVEGGAEVTFTVTTPGISTEANLYWSVQTVSGFVEPADFVASTGTVKITGHAGTFKISAKTDYNLNEGDSFTALLRTGSQTGPIIDVDNTPVITITDTEFYSIISDKTVIDEGGASVTYTITTPTADNNTTLYWKVIGSKGLAAADFSTQSLPLGTLSGTATVTNKTANITLAAVLDYTTEGEETFYIEVAKSVAGSPVKFSTPCPVIKITDGSKKSTAVTKTVSIVVDLTPGMIVENGNGEFTVRVFPVGTNVLTSMPVTWELLPSGTPSGTMGAISDVSVGGRTAAKGTINTVIDPAAPTVSFAKLKLYVSKLPSSAVTTCQVKFTITDPVTKNIVQATSAVVTVTPTDKTETITTTGQWNKPLGVNTILISMMGGGGQGGGAGAAFGGGLGGNAGSVTGIIDVTNINTLYFEFVPGGTSTAVLSNYTSNDKDNDNDDIYDWGGIGGSGGAGVILRIGSKTANPWVIVGGAGGGGSGRVNGPANGIGGEGFSPTAIGGTYNANLIKIGASNKTANGAGGGCGSVVTSQPYSDYPNAVSRLGGMGGQTYVPAQSGFVHIPSGGGVGGAGVALEAKTPNFGSFKSTSATVGKKVAMLAVPFQRYNIGPVDTSAKHLADPLFVTWLNVPNLTQGDYILSIYSDGFSSVVIDDKPAFKGDITIAHNFSIAASWNGRISLFYQHNPKASNPCGTIGIAATIHRVGTIPSDATYIWTTRSPGTWIRPQIGAGVVGTPANITITYGPSVPTDNVIKPVIAASKVSYPAKAVASIPSTSTSTTSGPIWVSTTAYLPGNGVNRLSGGWVNSGYYVNAAGVKVNKDGTPI